MAAHAFLGIGFVTYVVAREVVDGRLGQHAVVLELALAERRRVASDNDQLGLAGSETLERRLVAESDWHPVSKTYAWGARCVTYPCRTS